MANSKATKKALFTSLLSLLLCFTMLMGATFAWFTDTVTSANNIIKSGTLDVTLEWADGKADPATAEWKDASTYAIFDYKLWEPGYVDVKHVKIENVGTLGLKYQLRIVPTGEVSILADVIDVYYLDPAQAIAGRGDLAGLTKLGTLSDVLGKFNETAQGTLTANVNDTDIVTIALKMQESAGNEYQDKAIGDSFAVELYATQLEAEKDSFDNTYDKNATYEKKDDGTIVVFSKEGLSDIAALASTDESITSVNYNGEEVPVVRNTAGMEDALTAGEETIVLAADSIYTIGAAAGKTVTLVGSEDTVVDVTSGLTYITGAKLTLEGLTIQSEPEGAGYANGLADAEKAVLNNCVINGTLGLDFTTEFNNCVFNISGDYYNVWTWGAGTATFNGCTFNSDGKALLVYANVLDNGTNCQTVNVNDCIFNDNGGLSDLKAAIEIGDDYGKSYNLIVNKTIVNGYEINDKGINTGSTLWGNKNSLSQERLNVVIDGVDVY